MFGAVKSRIERFLATPAGERFMDDAEREAAAKETTFERRRELAAQIAEYRRRRIEEVPAFEQRVTEAEAVVDGLKDQIRAAERKATDARMAESHERDRISCGIEQAQVELTKTADPRIAAAVEQLDETLRSWLTIWKRHFHWQDDPVRVPPHPTDPDYRSMIRECAWYPLHRRGTNRPGMEAMKQRLEATRGALERLAFVAEPTEEEIVRHLDEARDSIKATETSPPLVWTEPQAPRYDREGKRVS